MLVAPKTSTIIRSTDARYATFFKFVTAVSHLHALVVSSGTDVCTEPDTRTSSVPGPRRLIVSHSKAAAADISGLIKSPDGRPLFLASFVSGFYLIQQFQNPSAGGTWDQRSNRACRIGLHLVWVWRWTVHRPNRVPHGKESPWR